MPRDVFTFLRAVRQRLIFARLAESAACGFAIGCVLAIPFILSKGFDELSAVIIALAVGALCILQLRNLPTLHQTALIADHQLDLCDLLSSTLAFKTHDDLQQAMLYQANAVTRDLSPSEVVIWKWGLKRFAAVGLTAAFTLTLALLQAAPAITSAADQSINTTTSPDASSLAATAIDQPSQLGNDFPEQQHSQTSKGTAVASKFRAKTKNGSSGNANAQGESKQLPPSASAPPDQRSGTDDYNSSAETNSLSTQHSALSAAPREGNHESTRSDVPPECRDLIRDYFK